MLAHLSSGGYFVLGPKDSATVASYARLLENCINESLSTDEFLQECEAESLPLTDVELHRDLYGALVALQAEGKNGIWGRIVKNAFAPLFAGHFDYVAGNPPWINWEHLPSDYRTATEGIWKRYRLTGRIPIPKRQQSDASKTDISILMTYVSGDKYLVSGGRLGFVITRSVFQSELGGWHFRAFRLPDSTPLGVLAVHDVDDLKPFRGQAANVTCTFSIDRDRKTKYPVRWVSWNAPDGVEVQEDTPIDEVQGTCVRNDWVARPVDSSQPQSSWIFGSAKAQNIAMRMIAKSYYAEYAREGVNTRGANGVYFVDAFKVGGKLIVRNRPSDGDDDEVQVREQAIEPDFLYPLLRGRNVARWSATPQSYIVLPHHEDEPTTAVPFSKLPQATRSFLNHFKGKLRGRKKFRNFDPTGTSWHGLYSVLRATFAPYKVVWREMASGTLAAVVASAVLPTGEEQIVIPDHKLFIIPCVGEEEAHFVCGLFNSAICEYVIRSYAISTGISTHVLDRLPIPRFDGKNKDHIAVANAALQCAGAIANGQATSKHEESLNVAALRVFGVNSQDAKVIENALVAIR